jgi:anti-anti-sigma factor
MPEAPLFSCTADRHGAAVILHLDGEVDLSTAALLQAELERSRPRRGRLVLDLGGLRFMDSSGLHLVLAEQQAAAVNGHDFVVAGARGEVRRALRVTGVDALVPCAPDWRSACG